MSKICLLLSQMLGSRKGAAAPTTYTISGTVTGDVVEGVTITLTGDASDSTTTDSNGDYSLTGLSDGSYTVTPSLYGYTFADASAAVEISGADSEDNDFVSTQVYIVGLPFYVEGGWEDGSTPQVGAQPANDWNTSASTNAVTITNIASPQIASYTPAQSKSLRLAMSGSGESDLFAVQYHGFSNDGIVFDKSKGIRVQCLVGRESAASSTRFDLYLANSSVTSWFRASFSNLPNPDTILLREYFNSGAYSNEAGSTLTNTTATDERWIAVGLELPANLAGNATARATNLSGTPQTGSHSFAINQDWSSVAIEKVYPYLYHHGTGNGLLCWVWIGSLTDDWPV